MTSALRIQSGRIKLILKFPNSGSDKILQRVLTNLFCLKDELPKYWDLSKFTNQNNIVHMNFVIPVEEWLGVIAARVGDIFEVKIIWKNGMEEGSSEVIKTFFIVGDAIDVELSGYVIKYLMYNTNLIHGRALVQKREDNSRVRKLMRKYNSFPKFLKKDAEKKPLKPPPIIDAREYASNIRSKVVYHISEVLTNLLAIKKKNKKEGEVYKYILHNLKLNFTDKPGPKIIKKYDDEIHWDKARTNPTI